MRREEKRGEGRERRGEERGDKSSSWKGPTILHQIEQR